MIKTIRSIEWVLVVVALALIFTAALYADDDPIKAMTIGVLSLTIAVSLSFVTTYLDKHS